MTTSPATDRLTTLARRLGPGGGVVCAGLLALVVLVLAGALDPLPAITTAAAIAIAALLVGRAWRPRAPSDAASAAVPPLAVVPAATRDEAVAALLAALPDAVVALDPIGRVVAFNAPAQAAMPTLRRGEPALLALRVPAVVDAIRRAAATGEPQRAQFAERVPLDRWYEAHVAAAHPAAGPGLLLLTLHDLTAIRRMEEMRADFIANASHELRTPLAALSGFIDTLQGSAREDKAAREKFLEIMKQQAGRMARLIDDLLSLSRIELNAHVPPETPLELESIVRQVADGLQMLAEERGVAIVIAPGEPVRVRGDRDELLRVFENLIENALKYGGSGGRVEVAIMRAPGSGTAEGEARATVRDHGPGIAPEHLPRLTERFYRIDVGHSRAEGGTGLGLALVKHILTRHRGRLLIESTLGDGATFTACFPALAVDQA
jgi:two-component system phosphate regulon sensor histidine kinase PhoR